MTKILRAIAREPLLEGFARALDMFGNLSRPMPYEQKPGPEADLEAIHKDWEAVGTDLGSAMRDTSEETRRKGLVGTT